MLWLYIVDRPLQAPTMKKFLFFFGTRFANANIMPVPRGRFGTEFASGPEGPLRRGSYTPQGGISPQAGVLLFHWKEK